MNTQSSELLIYSIANDGSYLVTLHLWAALALATFIISIAIPKTFINRSTWNKAHIYFMRVMSFVMTLTLSTSSVSNHIGWSESQTKLSSNQFLTTLGAVKNHHYSGSHSSTTFQVNNLQFKCSDHKWGYFHRCPTVHKHLREGVCVNIKYLTQDQLDTAQLLELRLSDSCPK